MAPFTLRHSLSRIEPESWSATEEAKAMAAGGEWPPLTRFDMWSALSVLIPFLVVPLVVYVVSFRVPYCVSVSL